MVEDERSPFGPRHPPLARLVGAGEGARPVAEELALEERAGDGSGVDLDQRSRGARAGAVEGAGEGRAAAPRLAEDQHRRFGGGGAVDPAQALGEGGEILQQTGEGESGEVAPRSRAESRPVTSGASPQSRSSA